MTKDFFTAPLSQIDPEVFQSIGREVDRQKYGI
jgi:hypothetical protein